MTVSDVRTAATRPVEPSARTRPDRGSQSCGCCSGNGAHADGSKCERCEGTGSVARTDRSPNCPGQGQPRRRHWREGAWEPSSGIFAPTTGFDPTLFDRHHRLRPVVRRDIMERLDTALRVDGGVTGSEWQDELRVYIAGGSASEWAGGRPNDTAQDLDILIGVDYPAFRGNQPAGEQPLDDREIDGRLNEALRKHFNKNGWYPSFGGAWDLTGYVNPDAYDIRSIKPYAAWDVSRDRWAVKPPHLPGHSLSDFDPALVREARAVATWARSILQLREPARTHEARALWEHVHRDRSRAFSAEGEGWQDPGNLIEKWLSYHPDRLMQKIRNLVYPDPGNVSPGAHGASRRVAADRTEGPYYHGTDREIEGDLIAPGHRRNDRFSGKPSTHVFFTDSHEEASGWGSRHVYQVEPTGEYEQRGSAPGDTFRSYMSPHPLRIVRKTAVTGYGDLNDRTAMVCLEVPDYLVRKIPGGIDEPPHITVVYLGKISDQRYWDICHQVAEVADRHPALQGVMHGIETFPASDSSDGKTPAFIPAYLPGIGAIRRELEHLNASKHTDFRPHVTLAYLEKGDPVPESHPARQLTFKHLTVKRGDQMMRFPLGGGMLRHEGAYRPQGPMTAPRDMHRIIDRTRRNGGHSISMTTGKSPGSGFMVAQEEGSHFMPAHEFFGPNGHHVLRNYVHAHADHLTQPGAHLGTWHDHESGNVFLDISHNVRDHGEAHQMAGKHNQIAMWDIKGRQEVPTGGSGGLDKVAAVDNCERCGLPQAGKSATMEFLRRGGQDTLED